MEMEIIYIIMILAFNSMILGLGIFLGYLITHRTTKYDSKPVPKFEINIPPIVIEQKDNTKYQEALAQREQELQKMAQLYYETLDKEEKDNKNRPNPKIETQDLSKTVNTLYEAFLAGDVTTGGGEDDNE